MDLKKNIENKIYRLVPKIKTHFTVENKNINNFLI